MGESLHEPIKILSSYIFTKGGDLLMRETRKLTVFHECISPYLSFDDLKLLTGL
jgi:hypothetical protein